MIFHGGALIQKAGADHLMHGPVTAEKAEQKSRADFAAMERETLFRRHCQQDIEEQTNLTLIL